MRRGLGLRRRGERGSLRAATFTAAVTGWTGVTGMD